jgi:hypothetical protein
MNGRRVSVVKERGEEIRNESRREEDIRWNGMCKGEVKRSKEK